MASFKNVTMILRIALQTKVFKFDTTYKNFNNSKHVKKEFRHNLFRNQIHTLGYTNFYKY